MKVKMTVNELEGKKNLLFSVLQNEQKYIDTNGGTKFTSKVSMAIAKNFKIIIDELALASKEQEKHKSIAVKKGVKLEELPEQKELMSTEMEVDIKMITEDELEKCLVSPVDVFALTFMTEETKEGGKELC